MNVCSLFFVLGVLGNLATCLVIIKNEYMRTTTNIYLFNLALAGVFFLQFFCSTFFLTFLSLHFFNFYISNLTLTDLGTLVLAMPAELYLMWRQYPWTFGEVFSKLISKLYIHEFYYISYYP